MYAAVIKLSRDTLGHVPHKFLKIIYYSTTQMQHNKWMQVTGGLASPYTSERVHASDARQLKLMRFKSHENWQTNMWELTNEPSSTCNWNCKHSQSTLWVIANELMSICIWTHQYSLVITHVGNIFRKGCVSRNHINKLCCTWGLAIRGKPWLHDGMRRHVVTLHSKGYSMWEIVLCKDIPDSLRL